MDSLALLNGLRFVDSFFPSGAYAFSSGLEAAVQAGTVRDSTSFAFYVEDYLVHGLARREAVATALAHRALAARDLSPAIGVDAELEAMSLGRESRLASRQMGRQVLKIAADRRDAQEMLLSYRTEVEQGRAPGHLAVVVGLVLGAAGWSREQTVTAFLYQCTVGFVSAALKLLPVGQREAQRLLEGWTPLLARLSREACALPAMTAWSPVQDIHAMQHARLTTRLFRS